MISVATGLLLITILTLVGLRQQRLESDPRGHRSFMASIASQMGVTALMLATSALCSAAWRHLVTTDRGDGALALLFPCFVLAAVAWAGRYAATMTLPAIGPRDRRVVIWSAVVGVGTWFALLVMYLMWRFSEVFGGIGTGHGDSIGRAERVLALTMLATTGVVVTWACAGAISRRLFKENGRLPPRGRT